MCTAGQNSEGASGAQTDMAAGLETFLKTNLQTKSLRSLGRSSGGCINDAESYVTDDGNVFVKINTKDEVLYFSEC